MIFGTMFERKTPADFGGDLTAYDVWKRQIYIPAHSRANAPVIIREPGEVRYIDREVIVEKRVEVPVTPDLEAMEATKAKLDERQQPEPIDLSGVLAAKALQDAPEQVRNTFAEYSRENIPFGMAFAELNAHWWPLKQRQVNDNHPEGPLNSAEQVKEFNLVTAMEWARKRLEVVAA